MMRQARLGMLLLVLSAAGCKPEEKPSAPEGGGEAPNTLLVKVEGPASVPANKSPESMTAEEIAALRAPYDRVLEVDESAAASPFGLSAFRQWGVAETAADALARIGPEAVDALVANLRNADSQVRLQAARALASMGAQAEPAVPALIAALKDPEEDVRVAAARALGQIGPGAKAAIPALIEALQEHDDVSS